MESAWAQFVLVPYTLPWWGGMKGGEVEERSIRRIADPVFEFMIGHYYYMFVQYCYLRSNLP